MLPFVPAPPAPPAAATVEEESNEPAPKKRSDGRAGDADENDDGAAAAAAAAAAAVVAVVVVVAPGMFRADEVPGSCMSALGGENASAPDVPCGRALLLLTGKSGAAPDSLAIPSGVSV